MGEATEIHRICPTIKRGDVNVLVCSYEFESDPLPDGLYLLGKLRREHPELHIFVLANFLPGSPLARYVRRLGVANLFFKSQVNSHGLVAAMRSTLSGQTQLVDESLDAEARPACTSLAARMDTLSKCQLEVLRYHLRGWSDPRIALRRKRTAKTVSNQRNQALQKLGLSNARPHIRDEALLTLWPWLVG
ncbi:helix-turn-helix transcriptional regulator [Pandoraea pulmonicola]|uniref:Transcriptional regulator RcsB n=1 Tax=Pandoraea pulmonicola TaxID=93221 RepID=A0AAJ4ZB04_PANPU|nr:LuxR C-terminal-related transcriptional regulator [Pandoraea pulmonicola]SUA90075.1 transcriptional regulator RcsB [Pandoraea pulmonicola]